MAGVWNRSSDVIYKRPQIFFSLFGTTTTALPLPFHKLSLSVSKPGCQVLQATLLVMKAVRAPFCLGSVQRLVIPKLYRITRQ